MNIAVLGFERDAPSLNLRLCSQLGMLLAEKELVICAPNVTGSYNSAFRAGKLNGGQTLAFLDSESANLNNHFCDNRQVYSEEGANLKALADFVTAGVVIGGDEAAAKAIDALLATGKPVIAVDGTDGIVESGLPDGVTISPTVMDSVVELCEKCL